MKYEVVAMQGYSDVNKLKKYVSFFRLRFVMGLQYRTAAFAGIATQFAWGFMEITVFHAFNNTDPAAFPMGFGQLASLCLDAAGFSRPLYDVVHGERNI